MSKDIQKRGLGNPFSEDHETKPYNLNKKNFYELMRCSSTDRKLVFLDGGNQKIFGTNEYSVQLNRIYFNIFIGNKRVSHKSDIPPKIEFLSLTMHKLVDDKSYYETVISPFKEEFRKYLPEQEDLKFEASEREIMIGSRPDIERVASMSRRFAEWSLSKHIIDLEMDSNDVFIRDGSLQTSLHKERKYAENSLMVAKNKNVIFAGLSKTSAISSDTGLSMISSIKRFADDCNIGYDTWCYGPIFITQKEFYKVVVMAIKLNKGADRIYRFELHENDISNNDIGLNDKILETASLLIENSNDIRFVGYPYGLYDADRWARVKNDEITAYEVRLKSELSKNGVWNMIDPLLKASDTHDRLDKLNQR